MIVIANDPFTGCQVKSIIYEIQQGFGAIKVNFLEGYLSL